MIKIYAFHILNYSFLDQEGPLEKSEFEFLDDIY